MAGANSLTYLFYTLLTLFAHDSPTTEPSLKAWEIDSEPPVTAAWNQDPYDYAERRKEPSCPQEEVYSICESYCQRTCKDVGKRFICPRICVPGCICKQGDVRGPNGNCIQPSDCPSTGAPPVTEDADILKWTLPDHSYRKHPPVTRYGDEDTDFPSAYTDAPPVTANADRYTWALPEDRRRPTVHSLAEQDPDEASRRRVTRIDPDEVEPYTRFPRVDPDDIDQAEQDPRIPGNDDKCPKDEVMSMRRHCERNCSNWDRDKKLCPDFPNRGCVCKPNLVRGPKGRCIEIKNCPKESGVTDQKPQPENARLCPDRKACSDSCKPKLGFCFGSICFCAK